MIGETNSSVTKKLSTTSSNGLMSSSDKSKLDAIGTEMTVKISSTTIISNTITISTSDPSGGSNGDIWIKYTA
jgi:hypothetical protein